MGRHAAPLVRPRADAGGQRHPERACRRRRGRPRPLGPVGRLAQQGLPVRISGTPTVDLEVTQGRPVGQLSVQLVDYGAMDRVLTTNDGALTLTTESCWGASTAVDDACYRDVTRRVGPTELQVLARGWIRLDGEGTKNVTVELQANDVVVPAGHQLGLVISGNRSGVTAIDTSAQTYSVNLATSRLNLPIEGPMASFAPGQIKPEKTADLREGTLPLLDEFIVPQP
ncbi:MAG TPA: CocE/NonD family hydrolase C-terminal non-catalytic domain-containing protein [Ornithinibacter sp.]|nr:CocE/NonD family hydrolase C-terminal non-catalytic domain-containing protein [Ornithinibacter sp.]